MDKSKMNSPRKQKQLGPAPIASFEDTSSDELKFKVNDNEMRLLFKWIFIFLAFRTDWRTTFDRRRWEKDSSQKQRIPPPIVTENSIVYISIIISKSALKSEK